MNQPPFNAAGEHTLAALVARQFAERPSAFASPERGGPEATLADELWQRALLSPAREFLLCPGKQIRARVCAAAWILSGGDGGGPPAELPAIIEILHAGSLIIDDIEDGSRERRGEQALHIRHGLPLALNTGNWLYFVALDLIGHLPFPAEVRFSLYRAASTTLLRCHQGQALDLSLCVGAVPTHQLASVVAMTTELKTGSLMELSAIAGALAAGGAAPVVAALGSFGCELGVGLQRLDDLGGLGAERRHKGREDLRLLRPTWPWAWLAEDNPARVGELLSRLHAARRLPEGTADADAALDRLCDTLEAEVGARGRARTHQHLGAARQRLAAAVGSSDALTALEREVARLEESYG